jgi:hypothetical protein
LGVMTKHHLVQIRPVAVSAPFCERESFSAGRERSEMPATTRLHCGKMVSYKQTPGIQI